MAKVTISKYDKITIDGVSHTIEEWLSILDSDLTIQAVTSRIRHGMTPQEAILLPRFLNKPNRVGDKGAARDFADFNRGKKVVQEPQYEWKFVRVNASAGMYQKVKVE